jgi:hypothetical protein
MAGRNVMYRVLIGKVNGKAVSVFKHYALIKYGGIRPPTFLISTLNR